MYNIKEEIYFYKSLVNGFKKYLIDDDSIIKIHKLFVKYVNDTYKIKDKVFKSSNYDNICEKCNYDSYKYLCLNCNYCETHCLCNSLKYHSLLFIFPSIWLTQINTHKYYKIQKRNNS